MQYQNDGCHKQAVTRTETDARLDNSALRSVLGARKRQALSEILTEYIFAMRDIDRITIADLMGLLGDRSMAALLLLLALPMVVPVPLPGISVAFGIPMALIAAQLALGLRQIWLPSALLRRSIDRASFLTIVERVLPFLRNLEKIVRPRLIWLAGPWSVVPIGLTCLILAIVIALPIPLGHFFPGAAIVLLSLGSIERDGVVVGLGVCIAVLGLAVVTLASIGLTHMLLP